MKITLVIWFSLATIASGAGVNSVTRFPDSASPVAGGKIHSVTRLPDYAAPVGGGVNSFSKFPSAGSPPAAPSGLQVTSVDGTGVTLGWTDNSGDETGFWVEFYSTAYGSVWQIVNGDVTDSDPNPTAANDVNYFGSVNQLGPGGIQLELSYCIFRVFATNNFGASSYSAEVQVPPSVTISSLAAAVGGNDIFLTWDDTGEYETNVQVWRSVNSGMSYSLLNGTLLPGENSYQDIEVLLSYSAIDLRYQVRVINEGGNGPFSNEAAP